MRFHLQLRDVIPEYTLKLAAPSLIYGLLLIITYIHKYIHLFKLLPFPTPSLSDLFWKLRHTVVIMDQYIEETDRDLPEYALPEKIEKFIEDGKYMNVEYRVTRENYQQRMHNLLYLEEYKQREDMSRYMQ